MMGHYYRGGKRIDITWGSKISAALSAPGHRELRSGDGVCSQCGKPFRPYVPHQTTCSKACRYQSVKTEDPIMAKSVTLGGSLRLPGKRIALRDMIQESLDRPCPYCGTIITLANASLDHKTPLLGSKKQARKPLDAIANLHIVCRSCNMTKGELSDKAFRRLLAFLRTDPELYSLVLTRMRRAGHFYKGLQARSPRAR
jgi:5-methylcytosine-specific restriction endonuclease McrA